MCWKLKALDSCTATPKATRELAELLKPPISYVCIS